MGSSKRHQRATNRHNAPQMRARNTRSKGKPVTSDPTENTANLTHQLRSLGLYAANTLGDGNCLFRALSDQLYGTPSHHLQLRADICRWIEQHRERYEPFVEDERGFDVHLRCMREPGTYGGHLELSAFAHFSRRNVKVIQPGLVYVIEWDGGGSSSGGAGEDMDGDGDEAGAEEEEASRIRRKQRKERLREAKGRKRAEEQAAHSDDEEGGATSTVYVAYHDWEHFSSIRNLVGPHVGIPNVRETPAPPVPLPVPAAPPTPSSSKPASRAASKPASKASTKPKSKGKQADEGTEMHLLPPLPPSAASSPSPLSSVPPSRSRSRSPSPLPPPTTTITASSSMTPPPPSHPSPSSLPPHLSPTSATFRAHRSPKRTFDESESGSQGSSALSDDNGGGGGVDRVDREEQASRGAYKRTRTHTLDDGSRSRSAGGVAADVDTRIGRVGRGDGEEEGDVDGDDAVDADGDVEINVQSDSSSALTSEDEGALDDNDDEADEGEDEVDDDDDDADTGTPALSAPSSRSSASSASSPVSSLPTPPPSQIHIPDVPLPSTPVKVEEQEEEEPGSPVVLQQLTRRQRKKLGLPKYGPGGLGSPGGSSGKIVIPGGRMVRVPGQPLRASPVRGASAGATATSAPNTMSGNAVTEGDAGEWKTNGTGRVDVRGFRELKI